MLKIMEQDSRKLQKQCGTATKFIISDNGAMDSELIPYMPHNLTINELGKQLLKAATDGKVEEIRSLMSKGAPFTADWLGTSPLHLAAQNNHLEVCEILIRAGMSRDARTKVDRTPLHMAVYEGHEEIVECLLKNGADYDCKDLLHMTPLHWAAQNGFAKIAATLIRYGAATHCQNKFNLMPAEIALQIDRPDIVQIINLGIRDPLVAELALEMISESSTQAAVAPILNLENSNDMDDVDSNDVTPLPLETVMMVEDETNNSLGIDSGTYEEVQEEVSQEEAESIECETNYSDSLKLLQQHGITMLPVDENNILNTVMETGHSVVLTEAGKQALNSIKSNEANDELAEYLKTKTSALNPVRRNKIITVTAEEFLAMTNNGTLTSQPNILRQINGKVINSLQKPLQTKRIVMKKNKVMSISPTINVTKVPKIDNLDVESLLVELQKARSLIEIYKEKLMKKDQELLRYKHQIKMLSLSPKHNS